MKAVTKGKRKPRDCTHLVFKFENKRKRMICLECGKRRTVKWEDGTIVKLGKWFKPKKPS